MNANPLLKAIEAAIAANVFIGINTAVWWAWWLPNLKYPAPAQTVADPE
ncbi:MAG: hypothetical protein WCT45_00165 [Candidatus Paceibacterota bacterium]|jgi:hypothetical protein